VIIQLVILFVLLLIVGLHFLDISCKNRDNRPFLTVVNRHVISLFVLLIMTAASPIICFLIIQGFYLLDENQALSYWGNAVSTAATSFNILLFTAFGIFLPRLYLNKTAFIDNPLARVPSKYPFIQLIQRIMF